MEHAYAKALVFVIERGGKPLASVRSLVRVLEREGRMALLPRIVHAFKRLAATDSVRNSVVLSFAKKNTRVSRKMREALRELGVAKKDVRVEVDPTLIGGWRLEGRGTLVDVSYKKALLDIYRATVAQ